MNIIQWDTSLFEWINHDLSSPLLDFLMPWFREPYFWLPFYVFILAFAFLNYGLKAYWLVLFIILTAGSADLISSRPIKKTFKRLRPCNTEYVQVIERVPCGSGFSFTSSHAANHFAVAGFLVLTLGKVFRKTRFWMWIWAGSVAFAQVYVGVHYPLDVICGALLGILLSLFWASLYLKFYGNIFQSKLLSP